MKATYGVEAKALYIYIEEDGCVDVDSTHEYVDVTGKPNGVIVDLGKNGELVGVEYQNIELETGP